MSCSALMDQWGPYIQIFHCLSGPRRSAQEIQTGFNTGVGGEAADIDPAAQAGPAVVINQAGQYRFEGNAMEGIMLL